LIAVFISFITTIFLMPYWIRKTKQIGLVWDDMNKAKAKKIAGSGGIIAILGFIFGVLIYVAIQTFYFGSKEHFIELFALTTSLLILAGIGTIDDLFGWRHGGLSKKSRIIMVLFASIPLMVINAGDSGMFIPFIGRVNIGLFYPLVIIPLGIVGASTTFNFLAGYNGLEAGQGIIILSALTIVSLVTGSHWLAIISMCMIASLFGFLIFNKYPAKVFPGDVLTYSVGALIASMAILGNYELFAVFIFIPYILETALKLRGGLKKQSFGMPQRDGSIKNKYVNIYGLEHFAIRILEKIKLSGRAYEWEVVLVVHAIQILFIILGFTLLIRW